MPRRIFRHVLVGLALLVAFADSARAQARIAVIDASGISILDSGDGTERARFPFALPSGETFEGFEASADGGRLYVTASLSNAAALYVIDASTGENVARIQIPNGFRKAAVTPDGSRAFVNTHDSAGDGISVVDLRTHAVRRGCRSSRISRQQLKLSGRASVPCRAFRTTSQARSARS
jgi:DNA-binding beta-propeller fold protein YncE